MAIDAMQDLRHQLLIVIEVIDNGQDRRGLLQKLSEHVEVCLVRGFCTAEPYSNRGTIPSDFMRCVWPKDFNVAAAIQANIINTPTEFLRKYAEELVFLGA